MKDTALTRTLEIQETLNASKGINHEQYSACDAQTLITHGTVQVLWMTYFLWLFLYCDAHYQPDEDSRHWIGMNNNANSEFQFIARRCSLSVIIFLLAELGMRH